MSLRSLATRSAAALSFVAVTFLADRAFAGDLSLSLAAQYTPSSIFHFQHPTIRSGSTDQPAADPVQPQAGTSTEGKDPPPPQKGPVRPVVTATSLPPPAPTATMGVARSTPPSAKTGPGLPSTGTNELETVAHSGVPLRGVEAAAADAIGSPVAVVSVGGAMSTPQAETADDVSRSHAVDHRTVVIEAICAALLALLLCGLILLRLRPRPWRLPERALGRRTPHPAPAPRNPLHLDVQPPPPEPVAAAEEITSHLVADLELRAAAATEAQGLVTDISWRSPSHRAALATVRLNAAWFGTGGPRY
jgi:hypothetical protein